MNRPSQIRRVIAEIRRALGPQAAAWEILQLAGYIVDAHRRPEAYEEPRLRSPFFALDVATAFEQDAGWKVVAFERQQGMRFTDENSDTYYETRARLRGFLGRVEWPRIETD